MRFLPLERVTVYRLAVWTVVTLLSSGPLLAFFSSATTLAEARPPSPQALLSSPLLLISTPTPGPGLGTWLLKDSHPGVSSL